MSTNIDIFGLSLGRNKHVPTESKWHAPVSDDSTYPMHDIQVRVSIIPIKSNDPTVWTVNHIYNGSLFNSITIFHRTTLHS